MIAAGVLILLFVAYQLWGTGLAEARSQDKLTKQFREVLAAQPEAPADSGPAAPAEAGDTPLLRPHPRARPSPS